MIDRSGDPPPPAQAQALPACPLPLDAADRLTLAHGGGGRLTRALVERLFLPGLANPALAARHDGGLVNVGGVRLAFATDSFVVSPLVFPGGDAGRLAVCGTVNDLAMCGARPLHLTLALIGEEGLALAELARIAGSIAATAAEAGVTVAAGDTKVVERGKGDGLFLATAGIGLVEARAPVLPARIAPGDAVLLSGDVGRHGTAVMLARLGATEGVEPGGAAVESDCAPLWPAVAALLAAGIDPHCLRDPTRGGLAGALAELALDAGVEIGIDEAAVPVAEPVRGACELLGLDPLYVANEGRLVAFVPEAEAERALAALRAVPVSAGAVRIGTVGDRVAASSRGRVVARNPYGSARVLDLPSGEQLPRIC